MSEALKNDETKGFTSPRGQVKIKFEGTHLIWTKSQGTKQKTSESEKTTKGRRSSRCVGVFGRRVLARMGDLLVFLYTRQSTPSSFW